jgi:hypothetical protein
MADQQSAPPPQGDAKLVFAISPEGQGDGVPLMLFAVTPGAWDYMRDGKTHTLDLTGLGIPIKVMMFGAKDRADALATIEAANQKHGHATLHLPQHDFGIKPPGGRHG